MSNSEFGRNQEVSDPVGIGARFGASTGARFGASIGVLSGTVIGAVSLLPYLGPLVMLYAVIIITVVTVVVAAVVGAVIGGISGAVQAWIGDNETTDQLLRASRECNDVEGKLSLARLASRKDPENAFIRYKLGELYWGMGRISEAISEWEEALRINPSFRPAQDRLREARAIGAHNSPETPLR